jgi:hypothetical protein
MVQPANQFSNYAAGWGPQPQQLPGAKPFPAPTPGTAVKGVVGNTMQQSTSTPTFNDVAGDWYDTVNPNNVDYGPGTGGYVGTDGQWEETYGGGGPNTGTSPTYSLGYPVGTPNYGEVWQNPAANPVGATGGAPNFGWPQFGGGYTQSGATPSYGLMAGANNALLQGGPAAGAMGALGGTMAGNIAQMFGGPTVAPYAGIPAGVDPTNAMAAMLSGQGNYGVVQDAVRAGAQPMLDTLFEDVMPQLRSRGISAANPTGEIKDLNRIVPRVMRDITNMGTQATLGEYNRAMGSRDAAASQMSNLAQQAQQFGSNLQQNALDNYRQQVLGLGGLGTDLLGQQSADMRAGLAMMPQTIQTGMMPEQYMQQYGQFQQGFEQSALQDAINRWNFTQNQPLEMANWYNQILSGVPGLGSSQTSSVAGNPMAGAAGGALAGGGIASMLNAGSNVALSTQPYLWPLLIGGGLLGAMS